MLLKSSAKTALAALAYVALSCAPAQAQTITLTGTIINACVLTLATPGILVPATTGTSLSTGEAGGLPATMTVVATGTNPTVTFSSAAITGPSSSGATAELAFSSPGGASRAFSGSGYVYAMSQLLDTITIQGRASNANGFRSGIYSLSSTATCSQ